jgi:hypothetical protein
MCRHGFLCRDEAKSANEYILVVGAVVVAAIAAFIGFDHVIRDFVGLVCPSVDTAASPLATIGSCITSAAP